MAFRIKGRFKIFFEDKGNSGCLESDFLEPLLEGDGDELLIKMISLAGFKGGF